MRFTNSTQAYGSIAKFFHWLIATLIIVLLIVGYTMDSIGDKSLKLQVFNLHKSWQ